MMTEIYDEDLGENLPPKKKRLKSFPTLSGLFDREGEMWDEGEIPYEIYMTEDVECDCGYTSSRIDMDDHWCQDLQEALDALH